MSIAHKWYVLKEHWRFKYGPRAASWLIKLSTYQARRTLRLKKEPLRILIDSNVLGHGITHETAWISTGNKMWGMQEIETGYAARIPVHSPEADSRDYENVKFLAGIAYLAECQAITLLTSNELQAEQARQPGGRYGGYGYFDFNVFKNAEIRSIDGHSFLTEHPFQRKKWSAKDAQIERLQRIDDPLLNALNFRMGKKNSLDAWHIYTAERHDLFCLLTMDYKLCNMYNRNRELEPFRSLKTKIMTPAEFARYLRMLPIPSNILSYNDASFFVRADLHWSNNRRRPSSSYRKN